MTRYIVSCMLHNEDDSITSKTWATDKETFERISNLLGEPTMSGMHPSLHAITENPDLITYTKEQ